MDIPPGPNGEKQGLDDFLVACDDDAKAFAELFATARPVDEEFARLAELNQHYIWVRSPKGVYELDTEAFVQNLTLFTHGELADRKVPQHTEQGMRREYLGKVWLEWSGRRVVQGLTYAPGQPETLPDGSFNLWQDTRPPAVEGDASPFYELLDHHGIVGEVRELLLKWCAYPLQHLGKKLMWAIMMFGVTGTGKTMLGNLIASCYGNLDSSNVSHLDENSQLHTEFNKLLLRKQFIVADEILSPEDRRQETNRLKSLITSTTINAREMYKDAYPLPNHANFWLTSNRDNALWLEPNDRRYLVLRSAAEPLETKPKLLKKLHEWYGEGYGLSGSHLRYHLEHLNLKGFNPYRAPIQTEAAQQMAESTYSDADVAFQKLKEDRTLTALGPGAPVPKLLTWEMIVGSVEKIASEGSRLANPTMHNANERVQTFVFLGRIQSGKERHRLWCWQGDENSLKKLSPAKLVGLYKNGLGTPKD